MATTSGTLAGKATTVQYSDGGDGKGGRFGLRAKVAAGAVALGCAAALALGGLRAAQTQAPAAQVAPLPAITLDWEQLERAAVAPGAVSAGTSEWEQVERTQVAPSPTIDAPDWEQEERAVVAPLTLAPGNASRAWTLAGSGYLEFMPGEAAIVAAPASGTAGVGLREYLDGEGPVALLASPAPQPLPLFGPQP